MGLQFKDVVAGLQKLGLSRGDLVEVHSSLSSLGWVEGGAETVIAALIEVVGEGGTIVMSAYNVSPAIPVTEEERSRGIGWKVRILDLDSNEPTGMGAVADTFRKRPNVVCGTGLHRTCAWGRDARAHTEGYENLVAADGWVLLVGVDIYRCSSLHVAERVPIPEAITDRFLIPDEILRDYPEEQWAIGYGSVPGDPWGTAWREAQERGLVRTAKIGEATCHLFKARELVLLYEDLRRSDPYGLFGLEEEA